MGTFKIAESLHGQSRMDWEFLGACLVAALTVLAIGYLGIRVIRSYDNVSHIKEGKG